MTVTALAPKLPRPAPVMGGPEALRHLRRDPVLKAVIRQIGPCTLRPVKREPYEALVRAIAHQQVHGRAAEAILGRFIALYPGHDFPPAAQVLDTPVEAMRACVLVRAKVAAIRARQSDAGTEATTAAVAAARRIALALALARPPRPRLLLTCGLSGSGKSTVARRLAESLGAVCVRADVERKRLHGLAPTARPADPGRLYAAGATRRTYARLATVARWAIEGDVNVIVDAAFLRRDERDALRALARSLGAAATIVECTAPAPVLRERLARRAAEGRDPSDATAEVLALQERVREPLAPDEGAITLDTDAAPDVVAGRVGALVARLAQATWRR